MLKQSTINKIYHATMATINEKEYKEASVSLLGLRLEILNVSKHNKTRRIITILLIILVIIFILLGIFLFVSFAKCMKPLRCQMRNMLDISIGGCSTQPVFLAYNASYCFNGTSNSKNHNKCNGKQSKEDRYRMLGEKTFDSVYEMINSNEGWNFYSGDLHKKGRLYTKMYDGLRYSKVEFQLDGNVSQIKTMFIDEIENMESWNSAMTEVKILEQIAPDILILHYVTRDTFGGIIAARDFINLRYIKTMGNVTYVMETAVTHPDAPPSNDVVRGFHYPGGYMFGPVDDRTDKVMFKTSACAHIGMWLPTFMWDRAKAMVTAEFVQNIKDKLEDMRKNSHT